MLSDAKNTLIVRKMWGVVIPDIHPIPIPDPTVNQSS